MCSLRILKPLRDFLKKTVFCALGIKFCKFWRKIYFSGFFGARGGGVHAVSTRHDDTKCEILENYVTPPPHLQLP